MRVKEEDDHMAGQSQERPGTKATIRSQKQPFDKSITQNQTSMQAGAEKRESRDSDASMNTQPLVLSAEDQRRVAEIAYGLYEQRGWTGGHDLEDWFKAERHIMTQGWEGRLKS